MVVAYAADNFVERNQPWIQASIANGIHIGLLILHPYHLKQAKETEGRDISAHINKTLSYTEQLINGLDQPKGSLEVRGYHEHIYYSGIFVDRNILNKSTRKIGKVSIQAKANFKSQHQGLNLTFLPNSKYSDYYSESCLKIWEAAKILKTSKNFQTNNNAQPGAPVDAKRPAPLS